MKTLNLRLGLILLFVTLPLLLVSQKQLFGVPFPYPSGSESEGLFRVVVAFGVLAVLALLVSLFCKDRS